MKSYCMNCEKDVRLIIKEENQANIIRGEEITSLLKCTYCGNCGEEIYMPSINDENLDKIEASYREQNNIIQVSEIEELLETYNVGAKPLSLLLGWGEVTLTRYLKGQLPNKEHSEKLKSLKNPYIFFEIFNQNKHALTDVAVRKVQTTLSTLIELSASRENIVPERCLVDFFNYNPDIFNGFTHFSLKKTINTILYFLDNLGPTYKSKLNKLLWYADMLNYKRYACAITGLKYIRDYYGPVPFRFDFLYGSLSDVYIQSNDGDFGTYYSSLRVCDIKSFSMNELQVLEDIANSFKSHYAEDIKNYSHKEFAYIETDMKDLITFEYAKALSLH